MSNSDSISDRPSPHEAERRALQVMRAKFEADPELARRCKSSLAPDQREARLLLLRRMGYINPEAMLDGTPEYREAGVAARLAPPEERPASGWPEPPVPKQLTWAEQRDAQALKDRLEGEKEFDEFKRRNSPEVREAARLEAERTRRHQAEMKAAEKAAFKAKYRRLEFELAASMRKQTGGD